MVSTGPLIRIGELSRRVGVSADRLRAWERRYRLLRPQRTAGGFRLYSTADELRVRAMQRHLAAGLAPAEAAAAVLTADSTTAGPPPRGPAVSGRAASRRARRLRRRAGARDPRRPVRRGRGGRDDAHRHLPVAGR